MGTLNVSQCLYSNVHCVCVQIEGERFLLTQLMEAALIPLHKINAKVKLNYQITAVDTTAF